MTVTKAQIMKRAWQLARWNRGAPTNSLRAGFGRWLAHAWKEAREDRTESWTFLSKEREVAGLTTQLRCLESKNYLFAGDYQAMSALRLQIADLQGGVHG